MVAKFAVPLALAIMAPCAFSHAQELPLLHPSRDVAVTYQVESTAGQGQARTRVLHMFWGADGTKLRLEIEGQEGIGLVDFRDRRMEVLLPQAHVVIEAPFSDGSVPGFFIPPGTTAHREGVDTVAGQACNVWNVTGSRGSGQACITADGVLLRAGGEKAGQGEGQMLATSVVYGAQPNSLFVVPPGFRRMDPSKPRR